MAFTGFITEVWSGFVCTNIESMVVLLFYYGALFTADVALPVSWALPKRCAAKTRRFKTKVKKNAPAGAFLLLCKLKLSKAP